MASWGGELEYEIPVYFPAFWLILLVHFIFFYWDVFILRLCFNCAGGLVYFIDARDLFEVFLNRLPCSYN